MLPSPAKKERRLNLHRGSQSPVMEPHICIEMDVSK